MEDFDEAEEMNEEDAKRIFGAEYDSASWRCDWREHDIIDSDVLLTLTV